MNNFIVSLNVVLPLFIMMALGYFLRRIRLFDDHSLGVMNNLVFRAFLPILLFIDIYHADLKSVFDLKLTLFAVGSVIVVFLILLVLIPLMEKENCRRGVLIQSIFRSNFIIFGLPVATALYGPDCAGITSVLIAFVIPLYNVLAVMTLEIFRGGKTNIKKVLIGIVTNPLVIAAALGILMLLTGIKLPTVVESSADTISKVATPLALIVLGGSFSFKTIRCCAKQITIGLAGKLIIYPGIFITLAALLGFQGVQLVVLGAMFGAPTAVTSYIMAQQMEGDGELAANLVVFGSAVSVITNFLWIFILKQLSLI